MDAINLICQLVRVTTDKDGGGKIVLEFGADGLEAIQRIQTLNSRGEINLAIAVVPYEEGNYGELLG